jgi:transcriptional regulator with XRE-family HTH domain
MHGSKLLAKWRKQEGKSQTLCAEAVGVRQVTWSEWEAGKKNPQIASAVAIEKLTDGAVPVLSWIADRDAMEAAEEEAEEHPSATGTGGH